MMLRRSLGNVPGGVVDASAMDFPDGAQRFNWCACQGSGLGAISPAPLAMPSDPATPLFDFSFWDSELLGGGGSTVTPGQAAGTMFSTVTDFATSRSGLIALGLAAAVGVVAFMAAKKK